MVEPRPLIIIEISNEIEDTPDSNGKITKVPNNKPIEEPK